MSYQLIMQMLQNPKSWRRTKKKKYSVYMCMPPVGTKCYNELELCNYETTPERRFILSGTVGEVWVVNVKTLVNTYCWADGSPITEQSLRDKLDRNGNINWHKITTQVKTPETVWALRLPLSVTNFEVITHSGSRLLANATGVNHLGGDFIICADANGHPDFSRKRVVNGAVFPKTYDLHSFPNMFAENQRNADIVEPRYNFVPAIKQDKISEHPILFKGYDY